MKDNTARFLLALFALLFFFTCVSTGCAGGAHGGYRPSEMEVAASCPTPFGLTVQLEPGVARVGTVAPDGTVVDAANTCAFVSNLLSGFQSEFEARWGAAGAEGWTVRIRREPVDGSTQPGMFVAGETWYAEKIIDIYQGSLQVFPHELFHVQLGYESNDHHDWACSFGPWEESVGLMPNSTESGYLPPCVTKGGAP